MPSTISRIYNQCVHQIKYETVDNGKTGHSYTLAGYVEGAPIPTQDVSNDTIPLGGDDSFTMSAIRIWVGVFKSVDIYEANGQVTVKYPRPDGEYVEQVVKLGQGSYILFLMKSDQTGVASWPVFVQATSSAGKSPDEIGDQIARHLAEEQKTNAVNMPTQAVPVRKRDLSKPLMRRREELMRNKRRDGPQRIQKRDEGQEEMIRRRNPVLQRAPFRR
ncbi:hypothetical protein H072_1967 [Dactylellina haptotyla CBS 200.50]|uniref:Uncharacterized protein n=1 Tax=Dactylellina haptotyla (strain CBS 200.50) TaxID=1284197 RepID=S8AMB8_DACHA|nr:hypothetical protein H072_1967 [Dactylellina haptotyla CBS 200.50]